MNRIKSVIRHMIQAYARAARGTKPRTGARAMADIARSYAAEMVEHGVIRDSYRPCSVCGAADHDGVVGHQHHPSNVFRCPGSVPSGEPSGGIEACRCDGTRILDEDDFDDARQDDQYAVDEAQL